MADGYEDMLRQGRELREMRRRHAHPESPCARCKRDACPKVCFPRVDYDKRRRGRIATGSASPRNDRTEGGPRGSAAPTEGGGQTMLVPTAGGGMGQKDRQ